MVLPDRRADANSFPERTRSTTYCLEILILQALPHQAFPERARSVELVFQLRPLVGDLLPTRGGFGITIWSIVISAAAAFGGRPASQQGGGFRTKGGGWNHSYTWDFDHIQMVIFPHIQGRVLTYKSDCSHTRSIFGLCSGAPSARFQPYIKFRNAWEFAWISRVTT